MNALQAQNTGDTVRPSRSEIITPVHKTSFNNNECPERKQGGNPRMVYGYQVFNASMDGNRQVDPQIAVGGGYVLHGNNSRLVIYNKKGDYVHGISQKCFNNGIDQTIKSKKEKQEVKSQRKVVEFMYNSLYVELQKIKNPSKV